MNKQANKVKGHAEFGLRCLENNISFCLDYKPEDFFPKLIITKMKLLLSKSNFRWLLLLLSTL